MAFYGAAEGPLPFALVHRIVPRPADQLIPQPLELGGAAGIVARRACPLDHDPAGQVGLWRLLQKWDKGRVFVTLDVDLEAVDTM